VALRSKPGVGRLNFEVSRSHTMRTHTHTPVELLSRSVISSSQMPLPTQHATNRRDEYPCPQSYSNPQSQQSKGRKPTPQSARPPGSTTPFWLQL